jgi:hypothetical protein
MILGRDKLRALTLRVLGADTRTTMHAQRFRPGIHLRRNIEETSQWLAQY